MSRVSLLIAVLFAAPAWAQTAADRITVKDAVVRLAPPGTPVTGAFMVLQNTGDKDVQLLKAESQIARATELHNHTNEGGVMKMRPVAAVPVKAKGETALKPGSYHVMLIDLKGPLKEGEKVGIKLGFDDGSSKAIDATVVKPGSAESHSAQHKH
ncbi:MAG TPA: copper chaperone PCu(A)C [Rhodocyclaceae bacterium]|nr:copper chaperone PCu(A)C [Rhodocyclaceae bacterium]